MSTFEKTPGGSRGTNMPSFAVPVMKFVNGLMIRQSRRSGRAAGLDALVLTTVGAKSGQQRQTLLGCFPESDGSWLIVASAGGSAANPAWYHNLAAHPDQVQAEVKGRTMHVTPSQLAGPERDEAWRRIVTAQPRYKGYEKKTDRQLPIIRLTATG